MKSLLPESAHLLAAGDGPQSLRALEFDLPGSPAEWALYAGGLLALIIVAGIVYLRDVRSLGAFWKPWLIGLRLLVLAALVVIALNPQERTQQMAIRPSRVAILVDTSLSMQYPEDVEPSPRPTSPPVRSFRSRSEAVTALLADSPLLDRLRERHEVSIYTFDSELTGPGPVLPVADDPAAGGAAEAANGQSPRPGDSGAPAERIEAPTAFARGDWQERLRPRGLETRLGESLLEAMRQVSGRTLSGLVVFSDGGSNAGVQPATAHDVARTSNVRLLTVGVGSTQKTVNLQVANIQAPTDVHVGDPYEFIAFVQGQGLAARTVEVELFALPEGGGETEPTLVDSRTVTLREDGVPAEVRFRRNPTSPGPVEYSVRARTAEQLTELTDDDNERRKTINVVDRKMRVLLIGGGPLRDYQFVRNLLFRHSAVQVDTWLQTVLPEYSNQVSQDSDQLLTQFPQTAAELFEYDVIVAFDADWQQVPPEQMRLLLDWVGDQAGGLILVAGNVHTPHMLSASEEHSFVHELYPVYLGGSLLDLQLDRSSSQPWPIDWTPEGRAAGFLQLSDDAGDAGDWDEFSGVYRCYPTAGAKPGATVYAYFSDPRTETEHGPPVLFASQFYGSGRTLYLGSTEMWRLRSYDEDVYDRFWTKAIREVGQGRLSRGAKRGLLLLERNEYALGQTVRVRAHLLDPQFDALDVDTVEMDVFDPQGRPLAPPRNLSRDSNRPGQYVGEFRTSFTGTYRIEIPIPASQETLAAKIDVVLPNLEAEDPRQNARLLADLARDTGGMYLRLGEAAQQLPELLPNRSEPLIIDERLNPLWDRQWVLFALVGILSLEWLTRKLLKLA